MVACKEGDESRREGGKEKRKEKEGGEGGRGGEEGEEWC